MANIEAGAHGPDEYYDKFWIAKTHAVNYQMTTFGRQAVIQEDDRIGGPEGEFTFVLRPESGDLAARIAIRAYADAVEDQYPNLATQLREAMDEIDERLGRQGVPEDDSEDE